MDRTDKRPLTTLGTGRGNFRFPQACGTDLEKRASFPQPPTASPVIHIMVLDVHIISPSSPQSHSLGTVGIVHMQDTHTAWEPWGQGRLSSDTSSRTGRWSNITLVRFRPARCGTRRSALPPSAPQRNYSHLFPKLWGHNRQLPVPDHLRASDQAGGGVPLKDRLDETGYPWRSTFSCRDMGG